MTRDEILEQIAELDRDEILKRERRRELCDALVALVCPFKVGDIVQTGPKAQWEVMGVGIRYGDRWSLRVRSVETLSGLPPRWTELWEPKDTIRRVRQSVSP